ncbi:MAG: hypothetical protein ACHP7J_05545 [Terriglobales bacterium]
MRTQLYSTSKLVALAGAVLATLFLVACEKSQPPTPSPATAESKAVSTEKVFVVFEGPWAIVADPKDANSVLALAPKTKLHRDLYVAASNDSILAAGTYDLSVPAHGAATSAALDPSFAQAKIDAKSLQHALDDKSGRYVIRLPKPEAYVPAKRFRSRVGSKYLPDASTEQNYASSVSFRYSVSSLNGFSLAGTPDSGTFNPLLLQVDTPTIRFAIEPAQPDDPKDMCHTHSRAAFHDTTKFLGLTLYVDFPGDSADCHKTDPQIPRSSKVEGGQASPLDRTVTLLAGDLPEVQAASTVGVTVPDYLTSLIRRGVGSTVSDLMVAVYFFHGGGGSCKAPILFLTTTP